MAVSCDPFGGHIDRKLYVRVSAARSQIEGDRGTERGVVTRPPGNRAAETEAGPAEPSAHRTRALTEEGAARGTSQSPFASWPHPQILRVLNMCFLED